MTSFLSSLHLATDQIRAVPGVLSSRLKAVYFVPRMFYIASKDLSFLLVLNSSSTNILWHQAARLLAWRCCTFIEELLCKISHRLV